MLREGELAIASRYPLRLGGSLQTIHPPHKWPRDSFLYGVVLAPGGDVTFCTVHLPSPRYGLQNILDRRTLLSMSRKGLLEAETAQRSQTSQEIQRIVASLSGPVIVAGDFNMPVESSIYRRYWGGFSNAFSKVGIGYGWTERAAVKGIKVGVRVDHVLTGAGLVPCACETGPDIGSDHLPLLAAVRRVSGNFP
jgi:endonuclease/exonuclease/phosphatase (EEP) superfamily protein YafD